MKSKVLFFAIPFFVGLVFTSCEKDEVELPKPTINGLELGIGDSHVAYIGSDLHIEAEIVAEAKIDKVEVELHMEGGGGDEIEVEYDEFAGLKNASFHKHIDIPLGTAPGAYHFHLKVTDQAGNQTSVEDDVAIEELVDEEAPVLTISAAPEDGESFSLGETISISGTVTDNSSLSGMLVALVYEADNIPDANVTGGNKSVIVMLHTHAFESPASHSFTASIVVGAEEDNNMTPAPIGGDNAWKTGNYYILTRCKDAKGNWTFSDRYPVVVANL